MSQNEHSDKQCEECHHSNTLNGRIVHAPDCSRHPYPIRSGDQHSKSDTPRMDAALGTGPDLVFAKGCELERELVKEKKENQRYFLIASLCQTIANHDVGEKLESPPISHPVVDAVLQLQAERDAALSATKEPWQARFEWLLRQMDEPELFRFFPADADGCFVIEEIAKFIDGKLVVPEAEAKNG